tara:strand:+ start:484 stop:837 length:354 start_codon:yes stop_codon:yes gene_type:complete
MKEKTFNDRMVNKTIVPIIYLWILAAGGVVGMGIWKPDLVIPNLDGFIALIAIIGGVASPALGIVIRMWENEQQADIDGMPDDKTHDRERDTEEHRHQMEVQKHNEGMTLKLVKKVE